MRFLDEHREHPAALVTRPAAAPRLPGLRPRHPAGPLAAALVVARHRALPVLPRPDRPYPLLAELAAGLALAIVAARVPSGWELAALAWLALHLGRRDDARAGARGGGLCRGCRPVAEAVSRTRRWPR